MYANVCPLCKSKFYSAKKNSLSFHDPCEYANKSETEDQVRPHRTSTPVSGSENVTSSFSDSVLDFFYQSWKNGLMSDNQTASKKRIHEQCNQHNAPQQQQQQPVCYSTQVIYTTTVVCQPVFPTANAFSQPVGYRPDGTFGVLPMYWPYIVQ